MMIDDTQDASTRRCSYKAWPVSRCKKVTHEHVLEINET